MIQIICVVFILLTLSCSPSKKSATWEGMTRADSMLLPLPSDTMAHYTHERYKLTVEYRRTVISPGHIPPKTLYLIGAVLIIAGIAVGALIIKL